MEIKIMVVPGKIARIALTSGMTVIGACEQAERQVPGVDWVALAKDREVRVQNRKFSNTTEVVEGTFGSIQTTPLVDGDVVLILTKIKGNVADAVLICMVNGVEFALETPVEARVALVEAAGINLADVEGIRINGEIAELTRLVGGGDIIDVVYRRREQTTVTSATGTADILGPVSDYIAGLERMVASLRNRITDLELQLVKRTILVRRQVIFGHLGEQLRLVDMEDNMTIQGLLDEEGDIGEFEVVLHNGEPVDEDDLDEVDLAGSDSVLVVPTTKTGRKIKFDLI